MTESELAGSVAATVPEDSEDATGANAVVEDSEDATGANADWPVVLSPQPLIIPIVNRHRMLVRRNPEFNTLRLHLSQSHRPR